MSQDELQGGSPDSDRTILVPRPGGRRAPGASPIGPAPAAPAAAPMPPAIPIEPGPTAAAAYPSALSVPPYAPPAYSAPPSPPEQAAGPGLSRSLEAGLAPLDAQAETVTGVNPLVAAANALLDLVVPLRIMATHGNIEGLRQQLVAAIRKFEADARAAHIDPEAVAVARYSLCTFLDETISSTPWGGSGVWASHSLLVAFHNEAFGGEKFFQILQKLSQNPRLNLHVLELMYLCLALGLEGRYRVIDGGRGQLDTLRERLQQLIQKERGQYEPDLSLHWKGSTEKRKGLLRLVPVWIIMSVAAAILIAIQLGLSFMLNRISDPVFAGLHRFQLAGPVAPPAPPPLNPPVRVAKFLAPEIEQGLLSVTETPDRSTIVLHGDGLFRSGDADLIGAFEPLLGRIGDALRPVPGKVIVIGHTDDVPSRSMRFPSNWALSKARAVTVVKLLSSRAGPAARYSSEGRGDTEPLAPNDSAANRARNRRVVIIVLTPTAAETSSATSAETPR